MLFHEAGFKRAADVSEHGEELISLIQTSIEIQTRSHVSHSHSSQSSGAVTRLESRAFADVQECLPPILRQASVVLLLSVGDHSRKLSAAGLGMGASLLMLVMVIIAAIIGIVIFKSNSSEAQDFDEQFLESHVHWKSPVASLGGSPSKPPMLPRLQMPARQEPESWPSDFQGYPLYQSAGGLHDRPSTITTSRPSTTTSSSSHFPSSPRNKIDAASPGRRDDPYPSWHSVSSLQSQPRISQEPLIQAPSVSSSAQHYDISTARVERPIQGRRDHPSMNLLASWEEQHRISLDAIRRANIPPDIRRQAPSVNVSDPSGDILDTLEGLRQPDANPDQQMQSSIPTELEAVLEERRILLEERPSQRPPARTPRQIVRDVNLRRSEAEEEAVPPSQQLRSPKQHLR